MAEHWLDCGKPEPEGMVREESASYLASSDGATNIWSYLFHESGTVWARHRRNIRCWSRARKTRPDRADQARNNFWAADMDASCAVVNEDA